MYVCGLVGRGGVATGSGSEDDLGWATSHDRRDHPCRASLGHNWFVFTSQIPHPSGNPCRSANRRDPQGTRLRGRREGHRRDAACGAGADSAAGVRAARANRASAPATTRRPATPAVGRATRDSAPTVGHASRTEIGIADLCHPRWAPFRL